MEEKLYFISSDLFDWLRDARSGISRQAANDVQEAIDLLSDVGEEMSVLPKDPWK